MDLRCATWIGFVVAALLGACCAPARAAETIPVGGAPSSLFVNPLTNTIFIRNSGAFANTITVLDVATQTTQSVPFVANVIGASLDLLRNRLRVTLTGGAKYDLVGSDLSVVPLTEPPGIYDRDANRYFDVQATHVDVIDGDTLAVQSVPYLGTTPSASAVAFDPVTRTVLVSVRDGEDDLRSLSVQRIGGSPPQVLDSFDAGSIYFLAGESLAIDPYANRSYVVKWAFDFGDPTYILRLDWDDDTSASTYSNRLTGFALDVAGESVWTQFAADELSPCTDGFGRRHAGTFAGLPGGGIFLTGDLAFNPASRRLYTEQRPCEDLGDVRAFDLDGAGWVVLPDSTGPFSPLSSRHRVNPATSKVYGIGSGGIVEYDEPVAVPVPMPTTITPGTPAPDGSVTVDFSATSAWSPVNHPVRRIYYQVDAIDGEWISASPAGATASAMITGLAPGSHTIHAFAGDGQEETALGPSHTFVTGPVASVEIEVPAPPACSNGADDDGDGLADFPDDPGCQNASSMREDPQCDDGLDNDGDGGVDWDGGGTGALDLECADKPWRKTERPTTGGCGLGGEIALVLGAIASGRRRLR